MGAGRLKSSSARDRGRAHLWFQSTADRAGDEASTSSRPAPPTSFLCPIHLDVMADPVTLHTGMTYDRHSIETWLTGTDNNTCPATNQLLQDQSLIPNHALRRAIHTWCQEHPWPSPSKPTVDLDELTALLQGIVHNMTDNGRARSRNIGVHTDTAPTEASLRRFVAVLPHLELEHKHALFKDPNLSNSTLASHLSYILSPETPSNFATKSNAAEVLHCLCDFDPTHVTAHPDAIAGLTHLLLNEEDDPHTQQSTLRDSNSLLKCLFSLCRHNPRNRSLAVESDTVSAVLHLMTPGAAPTPPSSSLEYCCGILESLSNCAEGREAIREHPLGIATLVGSLLGVSDRATEFSITALWGVVALAADRRSVVGVAERAGLVKMGLMVMSSECSAKAKGVVKEMLKLVTEEGGGEEESTNGVVFEVVRRRRRWCPPSS